MFTSLGLMEDIAEAIRSFGADAMGVPYKIMRTRETSRSEYVVVT